MRTPQSKKGCRTCRTRKIKCDLGQPECQRCFTTGRVCLGYGEDYVFKVQCSTNWSHQPTRRWRVCTRDLANSNGPKVKKSHEREVIDGAQDKGARRQDDTDCHMRTLLPSSLDSKAISCELFTGLFLDLFMPSDYKSQTAIKVPGGWVSAIPTVFHGRDDLLNKSLLALYTGFVGRKNGDARLSMLSTDIYTDALRVLRESEIWSSNRRQSDVDAKLASVLVFSRCELFATEGGSGGYMAHIRGGLQLLKRFGTRLPNNELSKMLVKKFRILGYYASVRHRKAFFMSEPPFSKLYLAEKGDPDYVVQKMFESVIVMPMLMEWADKLDEKSYTTKSAALRGQRSAQDLLRLASKLLDDLQGWYEEMKQEIPAPVPNNSVEEGSGSPPGGFQFASPGDKYVWTLYWVCALYANLLVKQLEARHKGLDRLLDHPLRFPVELRELGLSLEELDQYAESIRASLFSGTRSSAFDAQETMAPAFALQWYYEQRGNTTQMLWCIDAIKRIEQQGLALNVQVKETPTWCPRVRARFLAEVEG